MRPTDASLAGSRMNLFLAGPEHELAAALAHCVVSCRGRRRAGVELHAGQLADGKLIDVGRDQWRLRRLSERVRLRGEPSSVEIDVGIAQVIHWVARHWLAETRTAYTQRRKVRPARSRGHNVCAPDVRGQDIAHLLMVVLAQLVFGDVVAEAFPPALFELAQPDRGVLADR